MKTKEIKLTKSVARKILEVIDHPDGLVRGLGKPEPGKFCVEAAVQYVLTNGQEHNAEPACVGTAVRAFKIKLNDCYWSSNQARAKGMRRLAVAQLGSNKIDQVKFGELMFLRGTQKLLPFVFREIAKIKPAGKYQDDLNNHADICTAVKTFEEARQACMNATAFASAFAASAAFAYASAASAYTYAAAFAFAASAASAYTYDFKQAKLGEKDRLLLLTAEVGVECLIELKSPGTKWLDICKAQSK